MIKLTAAYSMKNVLSCFAVKVPLIVHVILNPKISKCS